MRMKMLACIPTKGNAGTEGTVSEHFGSAPFFTLYDTETGEIKIEPNHNAEHSHGTCHPLRQLGKFKIDCIVCRHMGRRAIEALSYEGIRVCRAESESVHDTIEQIKAGNLADIDPEKACRGYGKGGGGFMHSRESEGAFQPGEGRGGGYGLIRDPGIGKSRESGMIRGMGGGRTGGRGRGMGSGQKSGKNRGQGSRGGRGRGQGGGRGRR
ncbi:MAG: hypothetical protein GF307_03445 [candidate division Zixibacteria bacterium]|nr:hypothetical protein [candidate division Zixibacteria bacterium]